MPLPCVIAIDPGSKKCGLAAMTKDGVISVRRIVDTPDIAAVVLEVRGDTDVPVIVGDGTGSRSVLRFLTEVGIPADTVPERRTSEMARRRYLTEHPARGWRRLIPLGLRTPDQPYDDYVAVILAERHISGRRD